MGVVERVAPENRLLVEIAGMKVSSSPSDLLITYSLGSCVGLSLFDPVAGVGGMVHCMLPLSKIDRKKAVIKPYMFTDKGVPALLQAVYNLGARRSRLIAKVAGGASLLDEKGLMKIGERNFTVLRKVLWLNDILIKAYDTGDTIPRTMMLEMSTGRTFVKKSGIESEL